MATKGTVEAVVSNLVVVKVDGPVAQNEICYIKVSEQEKLMSEVIKLVGENVYVQVFESTRGLKRGAEVEFAGHMLEVTLGPGILSKNYDGLQNDLDKMKGVFLKRGEHTFPLDEDKKWNFSPILKAGDKVKAGDWLGEVQEKKFMHKIMVPFKLKGEFTIKSIESAGAFTVKETVAVITDENGNDVEVSMMQKWPVKRPIKIYADKPRPTSLLETGVRVIDTMFPLTEGGTGFIPGPFGCGKTVLQHAISKQAKADVVIVAACGERANEVVEIFTEFPELDDPYSETGAKLMDRTTLIANTSNMPVAAREASVYTAMTLGEYYRSMGLRVILLADSTSRWAQALREMSNRLEELPGQDAFPMDLSAIISNFYARAGFVHLENGSTGSITFVGTVSPAGGNLKEPVTESTKKVARCFYALNQGRADSKRYPAIDPIDSYSKYIEYPEMEANLNETVDPNWTTSITFLKDLLLRGKEADDQISILGDDGVPVDFHVTFWKSELIDFVILQQDAFDAIDAITPMARQKDLAYLVKDVCEHDFGFKSFEEVNPYFKKMIATFKQMNYSEYKSEKYNGYWNEIQQMLEQ